MSDSRSQLHPPGSSKSDLGLLDAATGRDTSPLTLTRQDNGERREDADLIRAMRDGCEISFDRLFARYWKLVFAIAWKILRQRSEAEDIVQEVFLAIYQRSDQYDPERASVRTWIAQFAYYKALLRRRSLHSAAAANLDELNEFEIGLSRFNQVNGVLERAAFVEQCLAVLGPRQRRILELVHFDGYTLTEVAAMLKQSLANTRNLYYRGLHALRLQMQDPHLNPASTESTIPATLPESGSESMILGRTCRP